MAYDIGTARGVIELDYNGRGIDDAQKDVDSLKESGMTAGQAFDKTAKATAVAGGAIAAGLAAGVNAAANFEHRMSAIEAVSGATQKEMAALSEKALQLGKDTQFSAGESAQAMEELIKAGLSVEDVLNGAADATVNLAAAGEVDMVTAATISSNAMNQFSLGAEDMVGVVDSIAGAANASAIGVEDFGQSLSQVGAVANLAGVSFDDTATAIALMGNAGIKGSDAGTSLKSMFQRLQPTTAKQAKLFKELGLITEDGSNKFYDAQGNLKDMASVSQVLQNSLKGMTKQQQQATLNTLFGSDAIRGAAVLADAGAKGFDKMSESMAKTSAADVAKTRMDNFKGSVEELKGSLETAGIAVGTVLIPPLRDIADAVASGVNAFLNLSDTQQKLITYMAAGAAAILLMMAAIIKIVQFIKAFQAALVAIRAVMATTWVAALGPIALVIAAIAAIVAVIVLLWKKNETFRNAVIAVWDAIKAAAMAVASWFMGTLVPFFVNIWTSISNAVKTAWAMIVSVVRMYIMIVLTVVRTVLNTLRAIWGAIWRTFGPIVKSVWTIIVSLIRIAWAVIKAIVILGARGVLVIVRAVWNTIKAITSAVWNAIKAVINAVWGVIGGTVKSAVNRIKDAIQTAWNFVRTVTKTIWNALKGIVSGAVEDMMGVVRSIKDKVTGFFSGAIGWLKDAGREIVQGLINGITDKLGALAEKARELANTMAKVLPGSPVKEGPLKVLNHGYAGKQIVQMVIDGIESMTPELAVAAETAVGAGVDLPPPVSTGPQGVARAAKNLGSHGLRLVSGRLTLDPSGRAFIAGVARDEDDADADFEDTTDRMG